MFNPLPLLRVTQMLSSGADWRTLDAETLRAVLAWNDPNVEFDACDHAACLEVIHWMAQQDHLAIDVVAMDLLTLYRDRHTVPEATQDGTGAMTSTLSLAGQERHLTRSAIRKMLSDAGSSDRVREGSIHYYASLDALAATCAGSRCWAMNQVFVHVNAPGRFVIAHQVAPDSCEMSVTTARGHVDVFSAYRMGVADFKSALVDALAAASADSELSRHAYAEQVSAALLRTHRFSAEDAERSVRDNADVITALHAGGVSPNTAIRLLYAYTFVFKDVAPDIVETVEASAPRI